METILVIIVILFIISLLMFIFLKKMVKEINEQLKKNYVLKLQDYDDLILERQKKIQKLEDSKKKEIENDEKITDNEKVICVIPKEITYQDDNLIEKLKEINENFKINPEKVIENFLRENLEKENISLYNDLVNLKKKLEEYGIYKLMINNNYLKKTIDNSSNECKKVINGFYNENISINDFMVFLNKEIDKINPIIYIEVGNKEENYDYLSNQIKTIYNNNIYRGIKIYYHSKLYNYCLE